MAEYTPSDEEVRTDYVMTYADRDPSQLLAGMAFDRWRAAHDARVRRDAAREALDGLIQDLREKGRCAADSSLPDVTDLAEIVWHAQDEARTYRDTHYPETED